jgi:large subunit ribosomal protein L11
VSVLVKQACGIAKASGNTPREKAGQISRAKVEEIAKMKLTDLNTVGMDAAIRMVEGTARSMGIDVVDVVAPAAPASE